MPSSTTAKAPASATALASASIAGHSACGAALRLEAAEDLDHLRRQADMAHHRNAALGQIVDGLGHARAAFHLHRGAAGFLDHARGVAERDLRAFLIGAERHVDDDERVLASRASPPCRA